MRRISVTLLAVLLTAPSALAILPSRANPAATYTSHAAKPWWEVYDDAMRAVDREDWNSALAALREAVRHNSKSSANARTYGMRFIEYFPYYYMGLAHYKLGDMVKALEYLDREKANGAYRGQASLARQIDFYLLAARRVLDQQNPPLPTAVVLAAAKPEAPPQTVVVVPAPIKEAAPAPAPAPAPTPAPPTEPASVPPDVMITRPRQAAEVREETIHVYGDVMDNYGIAEITLEVNGQPGQLRIGQTAGGMQITARPVPGSDQVASMGLILNFSTDVGLALGETTILVRARNIKGQVVTATRTVRRVKDK